MASEKIENQNPDQTNSSEEKNTLKRRKVLKALAGIPVLGIFAYELAEKKKYDAEKKNKILGELGLKDFDAPMIMGTGVQKVICCE